MRAGPVEEVAAVSKGAFEVEHGARRVDLERKGAHDLRAILHRVQVEGHHGRLHRGAVLELDRVFDRVARNHAGSPAVTAYSTYVAWMTSCSVRLSRVRVLNTFRDSAGDSLSTASTSSSASSSSAAAMRSTMR